MKTILKELNELLKMDNPDGEFYVLEDSVFGRLCTVVENRLKYLENKMRKNEKN